MPAGGTDELYSRLTEEDETRVADTPSPLPGLNSKRSGLVPSAAASSRCKQKQEQEQDWTTGGETGKQGCRGQGDMALGTTKAKAWVSHSVKFMYMYVKEERRWPGHEPE